jgi:glycogen phosphorylase
MDRLNSFASRAHIAYFTMEIALRPEIHTYSGGLGMLAGDTARSCADLEMPVVFVSLATRQGYLRQRLDLEGRQLEDPDPWDPAAWADALGAKTAIRIEGREVWIRPWLYRLQGQTGYELPVLLLDTHLDENAPEDRAITDHLYGGGPEYRLKQEAVLGIGGVRILRALGFEIETYHMNEGHAALLVVELLRRMHRIPRVVRPDESAYDTARVRDLCIFTTHTPVEAGHDRFAYELVERVVGEVIDPAELRRLAGAEELNMTRLALNLSGYVNGVAKRHAETSVRMFPGYRVHAVTNGVHAPTWTAPGIARLLDEHLPDWRHEPELLVRADLLPDRPLWDAHMAAKRALIDEVERRTGARLDPDRPLLGFARRMTGYKRADLLFQDLERLREVNRRHPFQVVMAGKAHPKDEHGKDLIALVGRVARELSGELPIVFVPHYDMDLGRLIVSGTDVWLNTPLPPLEASGTSGMKAALNGVLNLSVLDGWWVEACIEGRTGWAIGGEGLSQGAESDARALYDKLDHLVLPLYGDDRERWLWMMKEAIAKIGSCFNSHRMMRRYAAEAYIR